MPRPKYPRLALAVRSGALRAGLFLLIMIAVRFSLDRYRAPENRPYLDEGPHTVERVVDGDTILLTTGDRVRLLGVDTPESVKPETPPQPLSKEASEFTRAMISGKPVRLEFDREQRDKYGRILAWVWTSDGKLLNEQIVDAGFSRAITKYPISSIYRKRLLNAEAEARDHKRGLWASAQFSDPDEFTP